jgi:hypothetical protein
MKLKKNEALFADNQVVIYENIDIENLQIHLNRLNNSGTQYNMEINTNKTKVITRAFFSRKRGAGTHIKEKYT